MPAVKANPDTEHTPKQLLHLVFGGELNAAIIKSRLPHGVSLQAAQSLAHAETQV